MSSGNDPNSLPANQLVGRSLDGGWTVIRQTERRPTDTGSCFSVGYIVENQDGRKGFLKAIDYLSAFNSKDVAGAMKRLSEVFVFERELCRKVRDLSMKRIVHAIDHGEITVNPGLQHTKVSYLIFDLAECDIRRHLSIANDFDVALAFRLLHHVAVGLEQLHRADIAHQDLKPSNVLVFSDERGAKVCDLGRAWANGLAAPHDELLFAGDLNYAPPEVVLRSHQAADERMRRFAYDMYQLGNLIVFVFTQVHFNSIVNNALGRLCFTHQPGNTVEERIEFFRAGFNSALDVFAQSERIPFDFREPLTDMVIRLCEPDPKLRGHPLNTRNSVNQYSLERFVSSLNLLAHKAAIRLPRGQS